MGKKTKVKKKKIFLMFNTKIKKKTVIYMCICTRDLSSLRLHCPSRLFYLRN